MKTLLDILAWWFAASFLLVGAWAIVRYRQKSAELETSFDWPGHSFRVHDLPETEFQRAEAVQQAARRVG